MNKKILILFLIFMLLFSFLRSVYIVMIQKLLRKALLKHVYYLK